MTLERVERWFEALPEPERDIPLIVIDEVAYTPRRVLEEVRAGTDLGKKMQEMLESPERMLPVKEILAEKRLEVILGRYPPDQPRYGVIIEGRREILTPRELMVHIRKRTKLGKQWIRTEKEYIQRLLRR